MSLPVSAASGRTVRAYSAGDFRRPDGSIHRASAQSPVCGQAVHWLTALRVGLGHEPFLIVSGAPDVAPGGCLPLCLVRSRLFGRFLVSLPYVSSAGVVADDERVAHALVDEAVGLADRLDVDYLVLRHERAIDHPVLSCGSESKVHMRLSLPDSSETLWQAVSPKVRNQIRKGEKCGLTVQWGSRDLLNEFYDVFARNMRDLGTPVFSRGLFRGILEQFGEMAELCVVRHQGRGVAGALLIHGADGTEVPSASSLRRFNHTNANMLMYWNLLVRAIQRRQATFDFGRSTPESGTYRFKKQWGAQATEACWQYYVRRGDPCRHRPNCPKYRAAVRVWQRLPVWLTRLVGPAIVRGIP